jgi:hypothetical protein
MEDPQLYWHIELYSGEIIKVKPDPAKIQHIQNLIAKQEGAITTPTRSIIVKDIKDFRESDQMYTDQKLLEGASQAFKEPIYVPGKKLSFTKPDGTPGEYQYSDAIAARWVKKSVPRRKWEGYYSKIPSYRLLSENDNYVMMTFVVPLHQIDHTQVQELTPAEELSLTNRVENF